MKTLVAAFITTLLVFALSTVWSEVVQPGLDRIAAISSQPVVKGTSKKSSRSARHRAKTAEGNSDGEQETVAQESTSSKAPNRKDAPPASGSQSSQLDQVKYEEAKLLERQNTIEMIYRDIFRELETLKEIRRRSAVELAAAERHAVESTSKQSVTSAVAVASPVRTAKASEPKGSTERRMAVLVQGLVDRGNEKAAAVMLAGLKERESSKVLSLLRDPKTATQLADQIRTVAAKPSERY